MSWRMATWLGGLAVLGAGLAGGASPTQAACTQSGSTVTCADTDDDGFSGGDNLTVNVATGAFVQSIYNGNPDTLCPAFRAAVDVGRNARITTAGQLLGRGNCGLGVNALDGLTLTNTGDIHTDSEVAFGILALDRFDITNRGKIRTVNAGSIAFLSTSDGKFLNDAAGLISTTGADSAGLYVDDRNTMTNAGSILTTGSGSYGIDAGATNAITNNGAITVSGVASVGIRLRGSGNTITNNGTITALPTLVPRDGENSIGIDVQNSNNIVTNNGTIEGDYAGVVLRGNGKTFTNNGLIVAHAPGAATTPGAALVVEGSTPIVNKGTIRGIGTAAVLSRNANLSLTNTGRIEGDVIMGDSGTGGGITLGTGGVVTGTIYGASSFGSILGLTGSGSLANPVVNMGSLQQIGDGAWTLGRRYDFQYVIMNAANGALTLTDGLRVNGNIFAQRGRLQGVGPISAISPGFTPSLQLSITLAPGLAAGNVGTLSLQGHARFYAGAKIEMDITAGSNDRFDVSGSLRSGGAVVLNYGGVSVRDGQMFTLLTAASIADLNDQPCATAVQEGATGGCFTLSDNAPAFIRSSLSVTNTAVTARVQRVSYATAAQTPEQLGLAQALDRTVASGTDAIGLTARLDTLTTAEAQTVLSTLATDSPAAAQTWGLFAGQTVMNNVMPWLDMPDGETSRGSWRAWGSLFAREGKSGPETDAANFDYDMKGATAGLDYAVADGARIGVFFSRADGETNFTVGNAANDLSATSVGVYAAKALAAWQFSAGAMASDGRVNSARLMGYVDPLALVAGNLSAKADTGGESGFVAASYHTDADGWLLMPTANLTYTRAKVGALDERTAAALITQRETATAVRGEAGLRASTLSGPVRLGFAAFWSQNFSGNDRTVRARLVGLTDSTFTIVGKAEKRGLLNGQASADMELSPGLVARLAWSGILNDRLGGHSGSVGLSYRW